jgi:DNA-binding YbaB/EbfC family protein
MQAMLSQANNIKAKVDKALAEFDKKVFEYDYKNGSIITQIFGSSKIFKIKINDILIDKDDKEMLEQMVAEAINEAVLSTTADRNEISNKITSGAF